MTMKEGADKPDFFEQIEWPKTPLLKDRELWKQNVALVRTLCDEADQVEWLEVTPGADSYTHMPSKYSIGSATVEFLPHWGFVSIDGLTIPSSTPHETILEAVSRVRKLQELGVRMPKTS